MFVVSDRWKETHPDARVAVLILRNIENTREHPLLERHKRSLENELWAQFENSDDLKSLKPFEAYKAYYKRFKKTYPLLQQLKTLVIKKKSLPAVNALVDAMFTAEMKNLLLTAGHDLDKLAPPVTVDAAGGGESYVKLNGEHQMLKAQDMFMADREGIISSVLYGPDQRTRMTVSTRKALFVVYAPGGIEREELCRHVKDIKETVLLFSPSAETEPGKIFSSSGEEDV